MNNRGKGLLVELRQLRRGHGLHSGDLEQRVGAQLRTLLAAFEGSGGSLRQRLTELIDQRLAPLPGDLQLAVRAGFAMAPASEERFFGERMEWLGRQLDRDPRTAVRRVESGLALLAEHLAEGGTSSDAPSAPSRYAPGGWYVERMRATLGLHRSPIRLQETRLITATEDGLDHIVVSWSNPAIGDADGRLEVEVDFGGTLHRDETKSSASYWSGVIQLPRTLKVNEQHEYGVQLMCTTMRPFYVLTPLRRTDEFELLAKFDGAAPPGIQLVDGWPFTLLEEGGEQGRRLYADAAGEVSVQFRDLHRGLSYGIRWDTAS
jgi:hypothetical protein